MIYIKQESIFKLIGRIGVGIYLLGTWLTSFYFMTDGESSPLLFKNVSSLLNILFVIGVITAIFIWKTSHRYTICFILMTLSSIFFLSWLDPSSGYLNPWHGDVIKVGIYSLIPNVILIISMILSFTKYKKVKVV